MTVYVIAGLIAALMLVYMVSALGFLPWFTYVPFVLLFVLVFFWDKIRPMLPGARDRMPRNPRGTAGILKGGRRRSRPGGGGRRTGKRM